MSVVGDAKADRDGMTPKDLVVDTMVLAYGLLGVEEFREEALEVLQRGDIIAPDSLRAELANVVWQWVRSTPVSTQTGVDILSDADRLVSAFVPADVLWERALELAVRHDHPAYDTLFIALAELADARLVTYDAKLLTSFPERTITPSTLLA
ncbi:MAG: type II toxin-antitoxin system VapC family toxin [bacterium]